MTRANLKAAMDALQVKKPLRLQAGALSFAPPTASTQNALPTQVENPSQVEKRTLVGNPTMEGNQTQAGNHTLVGNPTPVGNHSQEGVHAQVSFVTQVENPTQVPKKDAQAEGSSISLQPEVAEQRSSVAMATHSSDALGRGYTRIPNHVLMKLLSGEFTRNEIKLALLIARFTISFQRRLAPLSKSVLERYSGLRGPAILEAISGLVGKGLVEKRQGDQYRPNQLGLIFPEDWEQGKKKPEGSLVENQTAAEKETQVRNSTGFGNPTLAGKSAPTLVGNPTHFKDINKNKFSLSELPEALQKYFRDLKPIRKRESEWTAFEGMKQEYLLEDISDCLLILQEQGIKRGEAKVGCHSPMAYLAKAIDPILAEVKEKRKSARDRLARAEQEDEKARAEKEIEKRQAAEWAMKEKAFLTAFPCREEQKAQLAFLLEGSPFAADSRPGWILGIGKWWESRGDDSF